MIVTSAKRRKARDSGVTLVEILIATSLMGLMMIFLFMGIFKTQTRGSSQGLRNQANLEVLSLFFKIRDEIATSSGVSDSALSNRLLLTDLDPDGVPFLTGYRVKNGNLQLATALTAPNDLTASKWGSPYNMTADAKYNVGSAEFLYCGYGSMANCTRFTDTNGNEVFDYGTDSATTPLGGGTPLRRPSEARRILLHNFTFNRQAGSPAVARVMPEIAVRVGDRLVDMGNYSGVAGAPPLVQSFAANTVNFDATFTVRGVHYDNQRRRLAVVGDMGVDGGGVQKDNKIFITSPDGVPIRDVSLGFTPPATIPGLTSTLYDPVIKEDGLTVLTLSRTGRRVYRINMQTGAAGWLDLSNAAFAPYMNTAGGNHYALAYDPAYPTDVFLLAKNASNQLRLFQLNMFTPGAPVNTYSLPAGLTGTSFTMFFDPVKNVGTLSSRDLFIAQNVTAGKLDVYRIKLASPTATDMFQIDLAKIGATATGTNNAFGLSYNFENNHLFVADGPGNRVLEVVPPRILSPRS